MFLNSKKGFNMEIALMLLTALVRVLLVTFVLSAGFFLTVALINTIFREEDISVD